MLKINLLVNKIRFIVIVFVLLVFVSGCKSDSLSDNNDSFVFTDALNREIQIERNPKRVAALIGGLADIWVLSGGDLCAAPEDAWDDFGLSLEGALNIGGAHSPNVEVLMSQNPDFVIASASSESNVALKDVFENSGIKVAYFDVDCFDDYLHMLDICTNITGRKDLYEQNGIKIKEQIDDIKEEFSEFGLSETEKSVLLLRASSGTVKTKGSRGTVLGEMLCDLGCINIADDDKSLLENLNIENIIEKDPYHIFVVVMGDDTEKAIDNVASMIKNNPAWGLLSAVKENRLHIMNKNLFHIKPNENWGEAYEELSSILLGKNK